MIDLSTATPSQVEVMERVRESIARGDRDFIYWQGGVRAGKSYGAAMAFLEHQQSRTNAKYLILCFTQTQGVEIYGKYFEELGAQLGLTVKVTRGSAPRIDIKESGNTFLIKGCDKVGKDKAIQGLTMDGLLADEVVLLNRDGLHQAEARVSGPGGLRIYTSNKSTPYHWTQKYYVNRLQEGTIKGLLVDCGLADNPHVDNSYQAERAAEFEGNTLKRFIQNDYSLDSDPLYDVGLGTEDSHVPSLNRRLLSLFGHPGGWEAIIAEMVPDLNGKTHLNLLSGHSLTSYAQLWELLEKSEALEGTILLNHEAEATNRWLRKKNLHVKGYRSLPVPWKTEVLRRACEDEQVWVDENQSGLLEALRTHSDPDSYTFPIVHAFEALAQPFKPHVARNILPLTA